jgi:hypothetical protein
MAKVKIECEAAATVPLDDLVPLQGGLKFLPEDNYQALKTSIVEFGFSFPVDAWKHKGKVYILDAHQRVTCLKRMRDEEGYEVPPLPVAWVKAKDMNVASRKLLAAASQYGQVTPDGLFEFMQKFDIDMAEMKTVFAYPEVDLNKFEQAFFPNKTEVTFQAKTGSKELGEEEFSEMAHTCPKCGFAWD